MSFSTLGIGASSLYAAQRAAEIAAHNVANANTPGYTKQRLTTQTAIPTPGTAGVKGDGMRGNGVQVLAIDRLRDQLSDLSFRGDAASSGAADARAEVLGRVEGVLGNYPDGASEALNRFFAAFEQLNRTPQDPAARANVMSSGREVAASLGTAVSQLSQVSEDVGLRMRTSTEEVNALAESISGLNLAISDALTRQQSPNDLMDQRDSALDRLATLAGATARQGQNGQVDVYVGNSVLVSGVSTRPLTVTQTSAGFGVAFTDGPAVVGGELGAYSRAVSVDLPAMAAQIKDVAGQLADGVNALHRGGYSLNGDPALGPDGGDFYTVLPDGLIAVRADLTENGIAASAAGARTDGNNALALAGLRDGTPSMGDLLRGVNSRIGAAVATANRDAKTATAALSGADQRRASANGVNVDEEMIDLVKFQAQYQAAARVISMADGFFDTIINRMGAGR